MNESKCLQELGLRITHARTNAELTQQALADKAAISLATLSKAERGYPMTTATLFRILDALGKADKLPNLFPAPTINPIILKKALTTRKRVR